MSAAATGKIAERLIRVTTLLSAGPTAKPTLALRYANDVARAHTSAVAERASTSGGGERV